MILTTNKMTQGNLIQTDKTGKPWQAQHPVSDSLQAKRIKQQQANLGEINPIRSQQVKNEV